MEAKPLAQVLGLDMIAASETRISHTFDLAPIFEDHEISQICWSTRNERPVAVLIKKGLDLEVRMIYF